MALEMGMNLVCSVLEEVVMCVCQYLFMSANAQTIHRKKIWYFFGFTALGASVYGCGISDRADRKSVDRYTDPADRVLLLGILLFHRKIGSLLLDLFVNILLILSIEVGIFLGNYLLAQGAFENLVWYGNVTMLFKMFFMIPVTAAAVMWRKRQKETEMGNLQILLLLLLPLFSVLFLYSLIEMGHIYMELYGVRLMVVNLGALVLLNFCFLYLFGYWFRSHKLERQLAEFQMQNELQYRYYAELEQKYRESRKIMHDMKNHLRL
mgnify:FL=1